MRSLYIKFYLFLGFIIISCNPKQDSTVVEPKKVSISKPKSEDIRLKNSIVNEVYYNQKIAQSKKLSTQKVQNLNLSLITNINHNLEAEVKILDTLYSSPNLSWILLAQESENESRAYLVSIKNGKADRFEECYYQDVVEYIMTKETTIKNNHISIKTATAIGDNKPTVEFKKWVIRNGNLEADE